MYTFRFAKDLNFEIWEATNGFLHRFCMQYDVLSKHITGESLDCPDYTQFMEEVLTPLLMQYEPQDVYNADETSHITSVYLTGLAHLSMRGCMYSQSGRIPTGRITAGQITLVKAIGTPRTVLVSCLLLTWKKNSDKILADSVKAGKKRIRMHHSKYKDIELALLYWIKDMRSRDHPLPLSKGILKAKAEQ